ncbi:MAG: DUF167 family protein [Patescibacteria group bacterium]
MNEIILKVSVQAGARRESVALKDKNSFIVGVREKAERNAANERVRFLIARYFHVPASSVRIRTGHHSKNKKITVVL